MDNLYDFDLLQNEVGEEAETSASLAAFSEFAEAALMAQRQPVLPQPPSGIPLGHPSRQQNIPHIPPRQPQNHMPPHHQPNMPNLPPHAPHIPPRQPMPNLPHFNHRRVPAPHMPPPRHIPRHTPGLRAIDPRGIARCMNNNTYVWLIGGQNFWFFPTFIGRGSVGGYRFVRGSWVYMGFDLNLIESFFCGGR